MSVNEADAGEGTTVRPGRSVRRRARPAPERWSRARWTTAALILGTCLGGCASPPIETEFETSPRTPTEVSAAGGLETGGERRDGAPGEAAADGVETVLWGGVLLESTVLEGTTQLEVLAHPLDRRQRPQTGRASEGRFLIVAEGYLETVDYAPGRLVTVLGTLEEVREGTIGEAAVRFPVVRAEQLHLWSPNAARGERPGFTFGIGVSLGN